MEVSMLLYGATVRQLCLLVGTRWPISRWLQQEWTARLRRGMCSESVLFRLAHSKLRLGLWSGAKMGNSLGRFPRTSVCTSWIPGRKGKLPRSQRSTKALALKGCSGLAILARSLPSAQVPETTVDSTPSLTLAILVRDQYLRIVLTIIVVMVTCIWSPPITSCLSKVEGIPAASTSSLRKMTIYRI